jgi:glycosyltransferase involved in cell wall biosynthesis
MLSDQKIVVVMPAYNAARTLQQTYEEVMSHGIVDLVIVVDDASQDETMAIARALDRVQVEVHLDWVVPPPPCVSASRGGGLVRPIA